MTAAKTTPIELTERLFVKYGVQGWVTSYNEHLDGLDGHRGHRCILYHPRTANYPAWEIAKLVAHEMAHVLVPDDLDHGPRWHEKMMEILEEFSPRRFI